VRQVQTTIQSGPEKITQSLIHHNFAIVGNKVTQFTPYVQKVTGNINRTEFEYCDLIFFVWQLVSEVLRKRQYRRHFQRCRWQKKSLQQANITEINKNDAQCVHLENE